jgi:hypothetical protein
MFYMDYTWDLSPNGIIFDEELNIDKLGWKGGDCFKIVNRNGRAMLVKMESVEQFARGHRVNFNGEKHGG